MASSVDHLFNRTQEQCETEAQKKAPPSTLDWENLGWRNKQVFCSAVCSLTTWAIPTAFWEGHSSLRVTGWRPSFGKGRGQKARGQSLGLSWALGWGISCLLSILDAEGKLENVASRMSPKNIRQNKECQAGQERRLGIDVTCWGIKLAEKAAIANSTARVQALAEALYAVPTVVYVGWKGANKGVDRKLTPWVTQTATVESFCGRLYWLTPPKIFSSSSCLRKSYFCSGDNVPVPGDESWLL